MKRCLALLMILLTLLCFTQAATAAAEGCTWNFVNGILTVDIATSSLSLSGWTVSLSEQDMLQQTDEAFTEDVQGMDALDTTGVWTTEWKLCPGAAGIVEMSLICHPLGSDQPSGSFLLEMYLDGKGKLTVLSLNGEQLAELPVN